MNKFKADDRVISTVSNEQFNVGDSLVVNSYSSGNLVKIKDHPNFHYPENNFRFDYPNPPHKDAEVIKTHFDGADIEFENGDKDWMPVIRDNHYFYKKTNYRAKSEKTTSQLEIERIESELRKQADITAKLADALKALKDK